MRRVHHEIRPQKASSSDPPTTGSSGDPRVTDPRSLATWASRESAIELGGPAIPPRPLPLCENARAPARHPRQGRLGSRKTASLRHCKIPWKHRWAGAATPTQRNTIRPQEPPRRASDVINGTNLLAKDNPRWPIGNAAETMKVADAVLPVLRGPAPRTSAETCRASAVGDTLRTAGAIAIAWLIGLPRRLGNQLFALNDAEAGWRGWQVTELRGGLGRQVPRRSIHRSAGAGEGTVTVHGRAAAARRTERALQRRVCRTGSPRAGSGRILLELAVGAQHRRCHHRTVCLYSGEPRGRLARRCRGGRAGGRWRDVALAASPRATHRPGLVRHHAAPDPGRLRQRMGADKARQDADHPLHPASQLRRAGPTMVRRHHSGRPVRGARCASAAACWAFGV